MKAINKLRESTSGIKKQHIWCVKLFPGELREKLEIIVLSGYS
jgi:hypothetical protein